MAKRNTGRMPPDAAGKRIRGKLRCGKMFGFDSPTWAADGKGGCNWKIDPPHDYNVVLYEIAD